MHWVLWTLSSLFAFKVFKSVKNFFQKYEILIFDKEDVDQARYEQENDLGVVGFRADNYDHSIDLRGTPTHVCPCGCNIWTVKVIFENYEIGTYFLDMECSNCGSIATAPTPVDKTGM